jgi:hypothetical protein
MRLGRACCVLATVLLGGMALAVGTGAARAADKHPYSVSGMYLEGCSCSAPCACELVGVEKGCQGVGAMAITSGSYNGVSLAGAKIAYATGPGDWVRLYLDVPNADQRQAAEEFARAAYGPFGPIEAVKDAKIAISGAAGAYELSVDGGSTMQLTTKPVLGGDNRTPIKISNIKDPLHSTVLQGQTVSGSFKDGERSFTLKDSNAYFLDRMRSKGEI